MCPITHHRLHRSRCLQFATIFNVPAGHDSHLPSGASREDSDSLQDDCASAEAEAARIRLRLCTNNDQTPENQLVAKTWKNGGVPSDKGRPTRRKFGAAPIPPPQTEGRQSRFTCQLPRLHTEDGTCLAAHAASVRLRAPVWHDAKPMIGHRP